MSAPIAMPTLDELAERLAADQAEAEALADADPVTYDEARAVVEQHVCVYVRRGDAYDHMRNSWLGWSGTDSRGGIGTGGHADHCPARSNDDVIVSRVRGRSCCVRFSLRRLYDEVRGVGQLRLFP